MNWYAVKIVASGNIVSYVSDDVPNYSQLPGGMVLVGPYPTQQLAIQTNQPIVPTPQQTTMTNLQAKASAAWLLSDVADWLKAKG